MTVGNHVLQFTQTFLSRTNKGPSIHKAVDCYSTIYEKSTSLTSACYQEFMIVSPPFTFYSGNSLVVIQFPKSLNLQTHQPRSQALPMCELQATESCAGSGNEAANAPYLPFHYAPLAATYEHSHSKMLFEPTYGFQNSSAKCLLQVTELLGVMIWLTQRQMPHVSHLIVTSHTNEYCLNGLVDRGRASSSSVVRPGQVSVLM